MVKAHLRYLSYVLRHKWFVLLAGLPLGVPIWRLLLHDWSKFLPREWFPYTHWFYGGWRTDHYSGDSDAPPALKAAYDKAWCHHMHKNDHHWQFWIMVFDQGAEQVLPMSDAARREMLADWRGAGRALGKPDTSAWYLANRGKMKLHPDTRAWIEEQLEIDIRERLACLAHQQWSGWMEYMFSKNAINEDGTWIMPAEFVTRWQRQMKTPYAALPEGEQKSDLVEADKMLSAMRNHNGD